MRGKCCRLPLIQHDFCPVDIMYVSADSSRRKEDSETLIVFRINIIEREFRRLSPADFRKVLDINTVGAFNCMHHAVEGAGGMAAAGDGVIVNVSSIAGMRTCESPPVRCRAGSLDRHSSSCSQTNATTGGCRRIVRHGLHGLEVCDERTRVGNGRRVPGGWDPRDQLVPRSMTALLSLALALPLLLFHSLMAAFSARDTAGWNCAGEVLTPIMKLRPVQPPPEHLATICRPVDVADCVMLVACLHKRANIPELVIKPTKQFYPA